MKKWKKRHSWGSVSLRPSSFPALPVYRCLGSGLECYLERVERKDSGISGVLTLPWSST